MTYLLTLITLACASAAFAQTSKTEWIMAPVDPAASGVTTKALCTAAVKKLYGASLTCVERVKTSPLPICPTMPPAGMSLTRTQACPAATYSPTGTGWTQTNPAVLQPSPVCWQAGTTWMPTAPSSSECPAIPPKPDTTQSVQCNGAPLVQTRTATWSGTAWVTTGWIPACVVTPPTGEIVSTWATIAREVDPFKSFTANGVVRYGHPSQPNNWVSKTFSGPGQCIGSVFTTTDPAPGLYKECQVLLSAPNVVQTGGMPVINVPLVPPAQKGYSTEKITNGGGFEVGPYDIGAFRTNCAVSHFAFDDPIVFPGQPGKSHLHMFFGNTGVNASSTAASILNTGDSTCAGGTANRTGYWVPAMVNLKTGAPVVPSGSIWYYKGAYMGVRSEDIKPFPAGLRLIAGNSGGTTARTDDLVRFGCASQGAVTRSIPNCAIGDQVTIGIQFPQCWDGVNLDSPDHKSHMAYGGGDGKGCPSTHPIGLPEISLNVAFTVTEARPDLNWKLSSDNYAGTGGYSMHADWFNGWKDDIMKTWVVNCINKKASSANAICDGRYLSD